MIRESEITDVSVMLITCDSLSNDAKAKQCCWGISSSKAVRVSIACVPRTPVLYVGVRNPRMFSWICCGCFCRRDDDDNSKNLPSKLTTRLRSAERGVIRWTEFNHSDHFLPILDIDSLPSRLVGRIGSRQGDYDDGASAWSQFPATFVPRQKLCFFTLMTVTIAFGITAALLVRCFPARVGLTHRMGGHE